MPVLHDLQKHTMPVFILVTGQYKQEDLGSRMVRCYYTAVKMILNSNNYTVLLQIHQYEAEVCHFH